MITLTAMNSKLQLVHNANLCTGARYLSSLVTAHVQAEYVSTTKYLWTASCQILFLHYFCFCSILITYKKSVHGPGPKWGSMHPRSMFCPHPHMALFVKPKCELTWSHYFLIAGFVVCASEWSEFVCSARRLQSKEILSIDFPQTKMSPFWLIENTIIPLGLSLAYQTLRNVTMWVHLLVWQTKSLTNLNEDMIITVVIEI